MSNGNKKIRLCMMAAVCAALTIFSPCTAFADPAPKAAPVLFAVIREDNTSIFSDNIPSSAIVAAAMAGNSFKVTGTEDGWVKIDLEGESGYLSPDSDVALYKESQVEEAAQAAREQADEAAAQSTENLRKEIVEYALSFVGGRYVYGGNDPHTGVDCSGFTRYVMAHAAGISLERTSSGQSGQGRTVSMEEAKPGDLVFYSRGSGSGGRVGHVAIYIGDGQIVHASTEKTGIKVSRWDYRRPLRIASVVD